MITIEELKKYSLMRGLNLGQAEVDYFQQIVLFIIYSKISKRIIFKGGTALQKCYLLERFSEDLDFSSDEEIEIENLVKEGLKDFLIDFEIEKNKHSKGENILLKIKALFLTGTKTLFVEYD
jgi:predicted nucleotidyltransferase component of viral defense system